MASLRSPEDASFGDVRHELAMSQADYTQSRVVRALRVSGGATRADLVRLTGLSRATVTAVVNRLLETGMVDENAPGDEPSGRGRPAATLSLTAASGVVFGFDFGHSHLRAAVADLSGRVLAEHVLELQVDNSPDEALTVAADKFRQLLDEIQMCPDDVTSVVMGVPSPVERRTGRIVDNNILPGWISRTPSAELGDEIGLPVTLENDANLAAFGEIIFGAARDAENLIYLKASTGIGAGLILDRRLYRGASGAAGEIGHVQVRADGVVCRCGSRGCLETLVSTPHIVAALKPTHSQLHHIGDVIDLVSRGDIGARRVVIDAGRIIGRALADLCNVLNPDALIVGGELSAAGTELTSGIREAIDRYTQSCISEAVTIDISALKERAEVLGAIAMAIHSNRRDNPTGR